MSKEAAGVAATPWTQEQRTAIEHVGGDLLVSAAAGSGKTAVLAERCARLVCELGPAQGGCGVDGLLVLTFTEAAANEMRGRIAEAIRRKLKSPGKRSIEQSRWLRLQSAMVDRASISTLHGFCARVLRQHFHEAEIDPSFEVIDEDEGRLMRDDVLTDVLERAHAKAAGAGGGGVGGGFAEFFEAYAQGREGTCREMILRVYRMLSSTADPAGYVAAARELYSAGGCAGTLDRFIKRTAGGRVRLLSLTARRAVERVRRQVGPGPMLAGLEEAASRIEWAVKELEGKGAAALAEVRGKLAYTWPRLNAVKEVENFDSLKKATWVAVKEKMESMCDEVLVGDAAGLLAELAGLAAPLETLLGLVEEFSAGYTAAKRAQNRLDFSDLERLTLNCLTAPGSLAAAELRARYCHLLVDEFQDINPLQAALLEAVRSAERFGAAGNLFVVGDVKQSIYGFRLAEPALFLAREAAARAATTEGEGGRRYVGLPHNFRSQPELLATMNSFFEKLLTPEVTGITYSEGHALQAPPAAGGLGGSDGAEDPALLTGLPVEMHLVVMKPEATDEEDGAEEESKELVESLSSVEEEARMVADRIALLIAEKRTIRVRDGSMRQVRYRDIAILLRTMKDRAMIFARALAARGVPVHADLSTGYFDTAEVRDALALLQVLDNPEQDIPLATALLGPYGRFSHDDIATLRLSYDRKRVTFPEAVLRYADDGARLEKLSDAALDPPPYNAELAGRLKQFLATLGRWRERLRTRPLHEGLAEIFSESKVFAYLAGTAAGSQRVANLQALHQRALAFGGFRKQGLHRFLRFIERLREQDGDFGEAPVLSEASDVVRIMSVHKSKGLEFPVVVVAGLGSLLKLADGGPVYVHRDLGIGLHVADMERNIFYPSPASACIMGENRRTSRAEELRLLYVAMTRARDHLILTGHVKKAESLEDVRANWSDHEGPLPEDLVLKGRTVFDWLLPALACGGAGGAGVQWPGEDVGAAARVTMALHPAAGIPLEYPEQAQGAQDETVRCLLAAEPLASGSGTDAAVAALLARVTGVYPHEALARQPAVTTVSQLKMLLEDEAGGEEMPAARPAFFGGAKSMGRGGEAARARGIATHHILELLDFSACGSAESVAAAIRGLVTDKRITAEEEAAADGAGITWCLTESPAGKLLVGAREAKLEVRREIPFVWASPVAGGGSQDAADWPTIRGVIDALLVDRAARRAEIIDYKTDSTASWELGLPGYRVQMQHYLRAAGDILGFSVSRATLVFLAARQTVEVTLK